MSVKLGDDGWIRFRVERTDKHYSQIALGDGTIGTTQVEVGTDILSPYNGVRKARPCVDAGLVHRIDLHASSLETWAQSADAARAGLYRSQANDLRTLLALVTIPAVRVTVDNPQLRTRQLRQGGDAWCKAAEAVLSVTPGASNTTHPAHALWLRVQLHRAPPAEIVQS